MHSALLIGMRTIEDGPIAPPYTPANDVILRYAYTGSAWQAPTVRSFPRLRSTALSPDGQVLLAASDDGIDQLDSVTFISTGSSAKPVETNEYIRTLAFTNDGNVVVATGYKNGSGSTRLYLYSMRDASFVYPRLLGSGQFGVNLFYYAQLGVSGDGSVALLGEPGSGGGRPLTQYQAATGKWVDSATRYNYYAGNATTNGWAPALNERGTRSVVSAAVAFGNDSILRSLDSDLEPSGALMNASEGVLLSADGNRAYVLERIWGTPNVCSIRAFDLTVPPAQATSTYSEITTGGFPIARSCLWAVNSDPIGILSPDGRTMFIAGAEGVSVIPLP
ncbi:MAG: WD40 repeat domain-containing protein [Steroidobacter sp.]|nr:WD40 repeat domain-containing protein [Steroidobacter sp.]